MMKQFNNFNFATLVWLTSVCITPTIIMIISYLTTGLGNSKILGGPFTIYLMVLAYGFIHSIPNWILLILATRHVNKMNMSTKDKKIKLSIIGILLTCILFLLFNYFSARVNLSWQLALFYSSTIVLGIWIIPLRGNLIKINTAEDILDEPIFKKI